MRALYAWLLESQGNGWFTNRLSHLPMPARWQGWAALAAFLGGAAATAGMAADAGWAVRIVLAALYLSLAFWTAGGDAY